MAFVNRCAGWQERTHRGEADLEDGVGDLDALVVAWTSANPVELDAPGEVQVAAAPDYRDRGRCERGGGAPAGAGGSVDGRVGSR